MERRCWKAGDRVVVGIDEVGRGAWAGPVTVAAVVPAPEHLRGVRDSKQISRQNRPGIAAEVRDWAVAIGVGHASHDECDALGMTDGNLTSHMRTLQEAGYVSVSKSYENNRPLTTSSLTTAGKKAFASYVNLLEQIVQQNKPK